MSLKEDLLAYQPFNEQEEKDREVMLALLDTQPDIFERKNRVAHFTASAWLVNQAHDKVLMIYHNIYHSWAWTGGHADGDQDLLHVALKEAREETGITNLKPVSEGIFSLEMLTVDGHVRVRFLASSCQRHLFTGGRRGRYAPHQARREQRRALVCAG